MKTYIITGAAGFIGSCLVAYLNEIGEERLILVDKFTPESRMENLQNKKYLQRIDRNEFIQNIDQFNCDGIFHLGARTDTTEFNRDIFDELNVNYSKIIWDWCVRKNIPLVYASSAAVYGMGDLGFEDGQVRSEGYVPLNPYGDSKLEFDRWVGRQEKKPIYWAGLRFFNVYGPNEFHKGRMASVVYHGFNQAQNTGKIKLFKSHHPEYKDGGQKRDFVYVKDVVKVCWHLMKTQKHSDIYNLGTGQADTFLNLAKAVFRALELEENIEFIPTPEDIRDKYQYFTQANMERLKSKAAYKFPFLSLQEGVEDYVKSYLVPHKKY